MGEKQIGCEQSHQLAQVDASRQSQPLVEEHIVIPVFNLPGASERPDTPPLEPDGEVNIKNGWHPDPVQRTSTPNHRETTDNARNPDQAVATRDTPTPMSPLIPVESYSPQRATFATTKTSRLVSQPAEVSGVPSDCEPPAMPGSDTVQLPIQHNKRPRAEDDDDAGSDDVMYIGTKPPPSYNPTPSIALREHGERDICPVATKKRRSTGPDTPQSISISIQDLPERLDAMSDRASLDRMTPLSSAGDLPCREISTRGLRNHSTAPRSTSLKSKPDGFKVFRTGLPVALTFLVVDQDDRPLQSLISVSALSLNFMHDREPPPKPPSTMLTAGRWRSRYR